MKILLLGDGVPGDALSELAVWTEELTRRWARGGHRVLLLCPALEGVAPPASAFPGMTVCAAGEDDFEAALGDALVDRPDVVHVATAGPFGARAIEALREQPLLLDVHDYWPICPRGDLVRQPRLETCAEQHPFAGCGPCAGLQLLRRMDERAELVAAARVVAGHSAFHAARLEAGLGRPVERLDDGVDTMRFRPDPEPARSGAVRAACERRGRPRLLFLGPPTAARGAERLLDLLVAVQARAGEVDLVVAGRDPASPDWSRVFRAEAAELGLADGVHALPSVDLADLPALIASCDVAIAPGTGPEQGGVFTLQALASGLPVVAHAAAWQTAWIDHAENGLLVDARDVPGFAGAVATLLTDGTARHDFGETARLRAMERHDLERSMYALENLYRRVSSEPRSAAA